MLVNAIRAEAPAARRAPATCTVALPAVASILDELRQVVFQTDRDGNWTYLNRAWETLTGNGAAAALGAFCLAHVHPDDRAGERERLAQLLSGRRDCCRHEVRYVRADGEVRWVEVFARARRTGASLDGTIGTLFDISERKMAMERYRLAAGVSAGSEEGVLITSAEGIIVDTNGAFETITGHARADVLGKNPRLLSSGRQDKAFYAAMWRTIAQTDSWRGEVWNRRKSGEFYAEQLTITAIRDAAGQVSHYVGVFADITRQKRQAEHIEHIALHDPLTGLANRRMLAERLQQAMERARRDGAGVAVACIDLDDFKIVNDMHGHACGDELLVSLGRRIAAAVRDSDTVCRAGGDEFVVLFDGVESPGACQPMLARLLQAIAEPAAAADAMLRVSASAGLAFYLPDEDMDADQLIRQADQAMYEAKVSGKNCYRIFDSLGMRVLIERAGEIGALECAFARREFSLHYQPIVHLGNGTLNSVEALVRWDHPTRGCLPPGEFLPAMEGHPLMLALENWILEEALRQHERWLEAGLDVAVSVNMSGAELRREDFVGYVRGLLAAHPRVKPHRIKLEVLESSALDDIGHVSGLIAQCAQLGIGFALDDFGTGYSSLRYLKQLPARRIKIDQSFVRNMLEDPDDLAILEGVMGMAAAFKREAVAEGVESVEHAVMLVRLGCMLAQGYGIARPMPPQALAPWLAQWRLPAAVAACAPLGRDDIALLKALVEQRAWLAAPPGHAPGGECPPAVQAFDDWLGLQGRRHARSAALVRRALSCRDAFAARTGATATRDPACVQAGRDFAAALSELLDA
jgi:diguanylate cyclase (GGDEF)-like protein/PAS domain S-box-containing protein